ncbi:hypothetical protein niasHS_007098 [Heterodera schachtii]|uniref:Transcription factor AP-2 C-terminal domain-containing protein n=1 Tax=Heterodera schachtii TaxID=97005 RepID=A0ABD2JFG7_HETSC
MFKLYVLLFLFVIIKQQQAERVHFEAKRDESTKTPMTTKMSSSSTWITIVDKTGTTLDDYSSSSPSSSQAAVVVVQPPSNHLQSSPSIYQPPIGADISDQQQLQQQFHPINIYETCYSVPGRRLTLFTNQKKYWVSIGEVRCGLEFPECMNESILGGILHNNKNKDGGKSKHEQPHVC